jgi:hypothetical protein
MTVETYVAVTFDVEQEAVWVWPPVPHDGVVAVVCSDGSKYTAPPLRSEARVVSSAEEAEPAA